MINIYIYTQSYYTNLNTNAICYVANISQISVTIHSSSLNIMFGCDFVLLALNGPIASKTSLFDSPGLYFDTK